MFYNEFVKAKPAIEESDILKSAFLANMSHEVRTQLNGILGITQMILQSKETDCDVKNDVKMIVDSGNSLLALFDNIVDMMKIEERKIQIATKPLFLNALMDEIFSMFLNHPIYKQKNAKQKNIILKYDRANKNIAIVADPVRLKQILVNLIENALKFTEKGYIYYGYSIRNGELVFYVMDSGIGIPMDKKDQIFDWFVQDDNVSVRKYGGMGLGLPISNGLARLMNGKIWCVSDVKKGSSFYFTIPYRPASMMAIVDAPLKKNPGQRQLYSFDY